VATATLTSKGQMTVPKEIRELLDLHPGDRVELTPDSEGRVLMRRRRSLALRDLFGSLPTNGIPLPEGDLDQEIGDAVVDEYEKSLR
jgi:AbrB family looped-hinge helix DNA binding protein